VAILFAIVGAEYLALVGADTFRPYIYSKGQYDKH